MTEIISYNPSNNAVIGKVQASTPSMIEYIVLESHDAFLHWKKTPLSKRVEILR
jgi:acyl-CoA reductase-like NAD-dependent aldehyde dehydrogenase